MKADLSSAASLSSWVENSDPCTANWTRITCTSGSVRTLDLSYLGLTGALPPSLAWATSLRSIRLDNNAFNGTLPAPYSVLRALTELQLQSNQLSGALPSQWSSLSALVTLNAGLNRLTGTVPAVWATGLSAVTRLVFTSNTGMCGLLPGVLATAGRVVATSTGLGVACPSPPPPPMPPPSPPPSPSPPPGPSSALLALRTAAGATWPAGYESWLVTSDPCVPAPWPGVSCSGAGSVIGVDLSFNDIQVRARCPRRMHTCSCACAELLSTAASVPQDASRRGEPAV